MIVEAAAGTGKTREVVDRIAELVAAGTAVEGILAVTFTDAAAGHMKLRVRERLGQKAGLDRAFIGTIHALCGDILRRRPVEAGIDPAFRQMADPEARRLFAGVFRRWMETRLATPSPVLQRCFLRLAASEDEGRDPLRAIRDAAWRLIEWRDHPGAWVACEFDRAAAMEAVIERLRKLRGVRAVADMLERLDRARELGTETGDATEAELLRLPRDVPRGVRKPLEEAIASFKTEADAGFAAAMRDELWPLVDLYQEEKQRAGALDFMDLLLYTRDLVAGNRAVRAELQKRYTHILIDEFQDTDPLQAEILLLLASADPEVTDWRDVTPAPGKLFLAGDPNQSIYRFRRADVELYRGLAAELCRRGVKKRPLQESRRAVEPIQQFVNAAFDGWLPLKGGPAASETQPAVVALPIPEPYGARDITKRAIEACAPKTVAAFIEWLIKESGWKTREGRAIEAGDICVLFRRFTNFGRDLTREYVRSLEARGIDHVVVGSKSLHEREEVETIRTALRAIEWPDDPLSVFAVLRGALFAIPDATLLRVREQFGSFHPFRPPPEEPVADVLRMLAELHRARNHRPIVDTIHRLLEHARAHAGLALRVGGERALANVYRLADLARSFEISNATSFRSFVDYLDDESVSGEAAEATIIEQDLPGVKLMTVHKAKGLEFPVVLLADLTCKLSGAEDRWVDTERKVCAQRLLGCTPWELIEHRDQESRADREEAWRVAYVAATRARDLLVVCANGDEEPQESWLTPLYPALYPPKDRWRASAAAAGCRIMGRRTVLNRPPEFGHETSVMPGLHYARAGAVPVAWFDPAVLRLAESEPAGLSHEELLKGTPEQARAGKERYQAWRRRRDGTIAACSLPMCNVIAATERTGAAAGEVEVVRTARPSERAGGRSFGKLVHSILQRARPGAARGELEALATAYARRFRVREEEIGWAVDAAAAALAHPLMMEAARAVRCHREYPVLVRLDGSTLVEGQVDLAFFDGARWTVVDFKTGPADEARYRRQLSLYAAAIAQATGQPARAVVIEV